MSDGHNESTSDGDTSGIIDTGEKESASGKMGPKRRASRAGTRSVATLSEAQLARKRANDREAQRLIRQRTKDRIEYLENRIAELSGGHGNDAELDELQRRNAELEEELRHLKEMRALSEGSIPPADFPSDRFSIVRRPSAPTSYPSSFLAHEDDASNSSLSEGPWPPISSPYIPSTVSGSSSSRPPFTGYGELPASSMMGNIPEAQARTMRMMGQLPSGVDSPTLADSLDRNWAHPGEISHLPNATISDLQGTSYPPQPHAPQPLVHQPARPAWELPIRFIPATGPVDSVLISLIQEQRNKALNGASSSSITGPYQPSMRAIAYPAQTETSHYISTVFSDLLKKTAVQRIPERAATLFIGYHLLQWQIYPCKTTYRALFDWQIPRTSQLVTPHPLWVSFLAWPKLRDHVIDNQDVYATEAFQQLCAESLNVNWPWRDVDCFVFEKDGEILISEAFQRHISVLANWSLDAPLARIHPELGEFCRFTEAESGGQGYAA